MSAELSETGSGSQAGFETRAIHAGQAPDEATGAVATPLHLTSTFAQTGPGEAIGEFVYGRDGNPTRAAFEACLANLEGAPYALAFSSGMAATSTVMNLLSSGDHVIANRDLYGGTIKLFAQVLSRFGVTITYADLRDPAALQSHLQPNTRLLWLETPGNPLLELVDIEALATIARQHEILTAVDNTFMSPRLQRPIELGADLVVHSTTKYISGHSDLIGGAVIARDSKLGSRLRALRGAPGGVQSPFDAWLCLRSLKTLALRVDAHCRNAASIAEFLQSHPRVAQVNYPGLPNHPQHALACRQADGSGGMLSFELDGSVGDVRDLLQRVQVFTLAESLGGVESLIGQPASMSHASVSAEVRAQHGIGDNLIRVSAGLETVGDLIDDLARALET